MKRLLLKISGEFFSWHLQNNVQEGYALQRKRIASFVHQIKALQQEYQIAIVMGGGNIVRGSEIKEILNVSESAGHHMGMLATVINGLCLEDMLSQHGCKSIVFSSFALPNFTHTIHPDRIENAFKSDQIVIFSGGTGQPFFSTDTAAVLYALRIKADALWKCTKVDGIYDADPKKNASARKISQISYQEYLDKKLKIMDASAVLLAEQYTLPIRVISMESEDTLLHAMRDPSWGSVMSK
jgi:uridylate kinase